LFLLQVHIVATVAGVSRRFACSNFAESIECELRIDGVLRSSAHAPVPPWDMMYPLRKEQEQGKRALLAFFIDGRLEVGRLHVRELVVEQQHLGTS
jgi:hypothetical protein